MTIGIVGAGQLGRMMALAGYPLGFDFLFLDRDVQTPGGQVGPILAGDLDDRNLLAQLSQRCEVLTFDWENIPVEALEGLPDVRGTSRTSLTTGFAIDCPES
jgi:5-(carboxyamino)imidazole ribonucleotide synthase